MTAADTLTFHRYRNDPEVARYQGWDTPYELEHAAELVSEMEHHDPFRRGVWTQLAVAPVEAAHRLFGDVAVRLESVEATAEVGFTLERTHWGQGYAREAVAVVVDYCFDALEVERVVAFSDHRNDAAHRVLEHAGLRCVATDGDDLVYYRRAG